MDDRIMTAIVLAQFVNLGMTVVTSGNAVVRSRCFDLLIFELSVYQTLFLESGLQESTATAAAVVIRFVRLHIDEIFFTYHGFDHKTQIVCNGIAKGLSNDLAGVLNRKLDLQILVPVGIDLQFSFTDPFGIIFIDVLDFKIMFDVEFFQSGPD